MNRDRMDHYKKREEQRQEKYDERLRKIRFRQQMEESRMRSHHEQFRMRQEMWEEMRKLHPENERFKKHRDLDFDHYYTRMKYARPISIIFIIVLWGLLFIFGGFSTGVGIIFSVFAALSTLGYIFQIISLEGIERRVLKPVSKLKKGMDDIAEGNYDVKVDAEGTWEVRSLIQNFNDMAKKLKENEALKAEYEENRKQLIASISHDLKTPMTSVLGYIEAVSDTGDLSSEKLDRYLKIIRGNVEYMNKLIDDLFLFSKLDMQKLSFDFADTAVSPFLSDMMEELKLDLEEKKVSFVYSDETDKSHRAKIDPKRFYQVIRNIIDNACKYGDKDLEIDAKLYASGNNICIDIANNGPAIPQDSLAHIFDRFYRLDTARTKDISSTGLGLAIAKELVEAHGGLISAVSEEGRTCFTITLPKAAEAREEK